MNTTYSLTSVEKEAYAELQEVMFNYDMMFSKVDLASLQELNKKVDSSVEKLMLSDVYSMNFKRTIYSNYNHLPGCYLWGFEYLAGEELEKLVQKFTVSSRGLPVAVAERLAANVNLNWDMAWELFLDPKLGHFFRGNFLVNLNDTVFTEEFLLQLLRKYKMLAVNHNFIVKKYRQIFKVHESMPDSWVNQIIKGLSS